MTSMDLADLLSRLFGLKRKLYQNSQSQLVFFAFFNTAT